MIFKQFGKIYFTNPISFMSRNQRMQKLDYNFVPFWASNNIPNVLKSVNYPQIILGYTH